MQRLTGRVVSVHAGADGQARKAEQASIQVELDGIVGDRHRTHERVTWAGDKQAEGTVRRNERQWSAVSVEELAEIQAVLDLEAPPSATSLGANLCLEGIPQLSRLPKGTVLTFPSGAALLVEEYNPPCRYMGSKIASECTTRSGRPLADTAFSKAAKLTRGIVGIVEVAGEIRPGDAVDVEIYETPAWLRRDPAAANSDRPPASDTDGHG